MAVMSAVATFHLFTWRDAARALRALALDRVRYKRADGLQFLRVLGTGKGSSTAPGSQWTRTALFCVFDDEESADAFIRRVEHRGGITESWHVKLRGGGGHGSWRGMEIPQLLATKTMTDRPSDPLAVITRANVRARSWRAFARDAKVVDDELRGSDGLLAVVGVGEAPILRLGTFSLWRNVDAMNSFARGRPEHQRVVVRTRREKWYGEEMFARFTPYASTGTWDGRDPLRD